MPQHHVKEYVPYTPQQIYDLVVDIECYPEFIPWCRSARILHRDEAVAPQQVFLGELVIAFKHIRESYVSRVTADPQDFSIDVVMERGPFSHLTNQWRFDAYEQGCMIDFTIAFEFKTRLLRGIIGSLFSRASRKMVNAFKERADVLYGNDTYRT